MIWIAAFVIWAAGAAIMFVATRDVFPNPDRAVYSTGWPLILLAIVYMFVVQKVKAWGRDPD